MKGLRAKLAVAFNPSLTDVPLTVGEGGYLVWEHRILYGEELSMAFVLKLALSALGNHNMRETQGINSLNK